MKREEIMYYWDYGKTSQAELQAQEDMLSRAFGVKVTLKPASEESQPTSMEETVNGIKWKFRIGDDGNAILTKAPKSISGNVSIPAMLKGAKVTVIDEGAFDGCRKLKNVVIPDSVEKCLSNFDGCNALASITISAGMVDVAYNEEKGQGAGDLFAECGSLCAIKVSKRNPAYKSVNGLLLSKGGEMVVTAPRGIRNAVIPQGVTEIGVSAFGGCRKLKSVTIPDGVMEIEWNAFNGCSALESVTIPRSVRSIKQNAFMDCCKLKTVTIPSCVKEIGASAFAGCAGLREIVVAKGNSTFESINGLLLGKNAKMLGGCWGTRREGYTLRAVPGGLRSVTIPDGVTYIDILAFGWCRSLESVTIPSSVTGIGSQAFYECSSLENITIPDGVTEIGEGAFEHCAKLKTVTVPASVKKVGDYPFGESNVEHVTLMPGVKAIYKKMFCCCTLRSVTIPDSLTRIGSRAFSDCRGLTSVTIPKKVKVIGDGAFEKCVDLKSVTLPASLKAKGIGRATFPKGVKIKWVK